MQVLAALNIDAAAQARHADAQILELQTRVLRPIRGTLDPARVRQHAPCATGSDSRGQAAELHFRGVQPAQQRWRGRAALELTTETAPPRAPTQVLPRRWRDGPE